MAEISILHQWIHSGRVVMTPSEALEAVIYHFLESNCEFPSDAIFVLYNLVIRVESNKNLIRRLTLERDNARQFIMEEHGLSLAQEGLI